MELFLELNILDYHRLNVLIIIISLLLIADCTSSKLIFFIEFKELIELLFPISKLNILN